MPTKPLPDLTPELLIGHAKNFSIQESNHNESALYGVTDGKAVGTYLEHKFQLDIHSHYNYVEGSSAKGIDFPDLMIDMKVTSKKQPQSSCPFKSARQKIYGLGYSLLVFVYIKSDDEKNQTANLKITDTIYIEAKHTADFQTSTGIQKILNNDGNKDDLLAFFAERMLPVDDIEAGNIADELLEQPPEIGYLTISNALQWRLQYARAITKAGDVPGIIRIS